MVEPKQGLEVLPFASQRAWERWLKSHHDKSDGIWMKLARKGVDEPSLTRAQAVEGALCYGWIDGQAQSLDDTFWLQKFTPRRARSRWSLINRAWALELIEAGRMAPAGLAEVERAQADGRWDAAYASPRAATVPDDLTAALKDDPRAKAAFEDLDARNRYAILHRIEEARRPATRAKRITQLVEMLADGKRLHP